MTWQWAYLAADGSPAQGATPNEFPTQGDAESFLGQAWPDLVAAGVDAVTLYEGDRAVYGPMSLQPPTH